MGNSREMRKMMMRKSLGQIMMNRKIEKIIVKVVFEDYCKKLYLVLYYESQTFKVDIIL